MKRPWTESAALPGGDIPGGDVDAFVTKLMSNYRALPQSLVESLAHRYGTLCTEILRDTDNIEALGEHFGAGLYAREVDYLVEHEWARTAEDVLWRRTKMGLHMSEQERACVSQYLARRAQPTKAKSV